MVEKKQVLYDLRITYNGPIILEDFFRDIDNWIREKGFEKEHKKKMEHVTKNGKRIEWVIEAHHKIDDLHNGIVILRALFDNIQETVIKRDGKKLRINNGDVFIDINGFIQSHVHGSFFQVKPIYYFTRALIDKFVYRFWSEKLDGAVAADCHDLFKRIKTFFNLQKYRYE